jgi:hypothetical protein
MGHGMLFPPSVTSTITFVGLVERGSGLLTTAMDVFMPQPMHVYPPAFLRLLMAFSMLLWLLLIASIRVDHVLNVTKPTLTALGLMTKDLTRLTAKDCAWTHSVSEIDPDSSSTSARSMTELQTFSGQAHPRVLSEKELIVGPVDA